MAYLAVHWGAEGWELIERQHGVISHAQLVGLGFHRQAIKRRIASGRLFRVHGGVYAVGRPRLTACGRWMAAVLAHGRDAVLSHCSAGRLWGIWHRADPVVEVSVPVARRGRRPGTLVHRRRPSALADATVRDGIPITSVARTIIDLAPRVGRARLERLVGDADKQDLIGPDRLRAAATEAPRLPGARIVRRALDVRTFRLTDSELERRLLRTTRGLDAGRPQTGARVAGIKVDFFWPRLGLVVETDGLRYHRTPAQQALDRRRDQLLTKAGFTVLRFTHEQVRYKPREVHSTLASVAAQLRAKAGE